MHVQGKKTAVKIISLYQEYLRGLLPSSCRFVPSCSEYTKQAIIKYGIVIGVYKGLRRLFSCHPFSHRHEYDPLL